MGNKSNRYLHQRTGNYDEVCWRKGCTTKAMMTEEVDLKDFGVGRTRPCMFCGAVETPEGEVYEGVLGSGYSDG